MYWTVLQGECGRSAREAAGHSPPGALVDHSTRHLADGGDISGVLYGVAGGVWEEWVRGSRHPPPATLVDHSTRTLLMVEANAMGRGTTEDMIRG